ncbi:hypothetical protein ASE04_09255 [Rhizobium sp. Root708]|nr:hypothetical protein ASE04_09255 [Rhizobium sp. Root708]
MQPELCVFAVEGFDEARAFENFQDVYPGGGSERDRLSARFGEPTSGFDKLNETQICFRVFAYIKKNGIITLE